MSLARRHPVIVISVVTAVAMLTGATAWAVTYDHSASQKILPGTTVGGVSVAGLRYDAALAAVRNRVEAPLHQPLRIQSDQFDTKTTAWDLGLRVDVASAVKTAVNHAHSGNILQRLWRRLFGHGNHQVAATPKWGTGQLNALLQQAAQTVNQPARDAKVDASSGWVNIVAPKVGRQLDVEKSRAAILEATRRGDTSIGLVADTLQPKVGAAAVSKVLLVRTGENMLYLYENGKITKSWPVATGQPAYPTPTGTFQVVSKIVNPTWTNPGSSWSGGMPATIGPGPNNPLGTRALALSASGILIHATPDVGSIGFSVSHGCIRMNPSDEMDVFGRVDAGTPVAIVNAGPPRARGSSAPAAATPDQAASTQY